MPVSTRIIRVLDGQYTLELEVEVDSSDELLGELCKTEWGKKIAFLLSKMLPEVPEIQTEEEKLSIEEDIKRIKEHDEKLREEGRTEIRREYCGLTIIEIRKRARKDAERLMRKKYMAYIRKNVLKKFQKTQSSKDDPCYGNFSVSNDKCNKCASRLECRRETEIRFRDQALVESVCRTPSSFSAMGRSRNVF